MKRLKLLALLMIFFFTACQKPELIIKPEKDIEKTNIPTLFIHGYSGSYRTMEKMITTLEKSDITKKEMIIRVSEEGELAVETGLTTEFKENNPSIHLIYNNSKSSQWHQAEWLKSALTYLKTEFNVEEVNIVGFSMGGISSFLYMETFSDETTQPVVEKLVAIGAPFNEFIEDNQQLEADILQNGPNQISEQLANYESLVQNLPKESSYFLIGGQLSENNLSDGTVPLNSSLGIYSLLDRNGYPVKYQVIQGSKGKHSSLKNNSEVIKLTGDYLWGN